jgi:hypothetical protein
MTDDDLKLKLESEAAAGDEYKRVYDSILEGFFARKQLELFEAFTATAATETEALVIIKLQSTAMESLRSEFLTAIETGRLAKMQINETLEKEKDNGH